jgi:hypothetical protein
MIVSTPGRVALRKELLEQEPGKPARIVSNYAVLFEEIIQDHPITKLLKFRQIDDDLLRPLAAIPSGDFR